MENKKISEKDINKFKDLINKSKNKKLIKSHEEAFQKISVKEEKHKGSVKYFVN